MSDPSALLLSSGIETPPLVRALAIVLIAAAICGYLAHRLKVVPIVGYLLAGAIVGPFGLGLIDDTGLVDQLGEIGVLFLMFAIGLELGGDALKRLGGLMLGGGSIQVLVTIGLVAGGLIALGGTSTGDAVFTGCLIALSSTAVVLKLIQSRRASDTPVGQVAIAFLILQDLAVVLMVMLVPTLGDGGGGLGDIVAQGAKALVVIVLVLIASRFALPRMLSAVSRQTDGEGFLFALLAIAVGIAFLVTLIGLTASIGAFVAGLVVSGGEFKERAEKYVMPFQVIFAGVFFASIGMLLDLGFVASALGTIAVLAALVIGVKVVGVGTAAVLFRRPIRVAAASALLLAQIGEFSFVLNAVGTDAGLSFAGREDDASQAFIAVAVLLIALTPLLDVAGRRIAEEPTPAPAP